MIVLITVHGIGFQRAPSALDVSDGYADALHEGLRAHLGAKLGDDPNRLAAGGRGPVYVQSEFPPRSGATEAGAGRLGRWIASGSVGIVGVPLAPPGAEVAHVALVYSGLEEQGTDLVALRGLEVLGLPSLASYATLGGIARMIVSDLEALRRSHAAAGAAAHRGVFGRLLRRRGDEPPADAAGTGSLASLRAFEDGVAAYVARNEHRERVRAFLRDAVSRVLARSDVDGVAVNGLSNGTVMAFDTIAALSPPSARGVRLLITAGSPLRKYVDLFDWGRDAGAMRHLSGGWTNVWDPADWVADPLGPPRGWRRGDPLPDGGGPGLFVVHDPDTGAELPRPVTDVQVDNVRDAAGGAPDPHDYWDNDSFCAAAAALISGALR
ncbi:MAG: hypothetical protein ABSA40_08035 [Candidatus Dormibacteria bacterium]